MSAPTTHAGGCHCGRVRFEVSLDLAQPVVTCNCSYCSKTGALLAFAPADAFTLQAGGELPDYQFNKKVLHHPFCPVCGLHAFSRGTAPDGREMVAINVRCLDEVDLAALKLHPVDGKSR